MARSKSEAGEGKYYASVREKNKTIPDALLKLLIRQKYHIGGEHSAAKICHWTGSQLTGGEACYKNRFYGIASHRCIQGTPVLLFCNHACVFCWRVMPEKSMKFDELPAKKFQWDEPEKIVEWLLDAQREIISGFGGNRKVSKKMYDEAMKPKHVALSLTGEPTMYPYMSRLLEEFHANGITTFLVTNGTFPERIASWKTMPTQLYVSLVAPNGEVYRKYIRPASPNLWKKYLKTLGMMPELGKRTRTVLRMTITRGVNDSDLEGYVKQIRLAKPHFVEVKSMVFVGGARLEGRGLEKGSMMEMEEMEKLAEELAERAGYFVSDRHVPSRVVLLCRDREAEKGRGVYSKFVG